MTEPSDRLDRCATRSLAAEEPLAGTASTIRRWLLIEHAGPWGHDGLLDARLPDGVGSALRGLEARTRCRVLLIRRPNRAHGDGTVCVGVDTAEPWMGSVPISRPVDALALDVGDRAGFPGTVAGPLAVVCTHGRRDPCCAERGRPLAAATAAVHPDAVWESTHVGGDRFAGNLVVFPHGLVYGQVEPGRGAEIVAAAAAGRIVLDRFRGRTSTPMHAQAAEHGIRTRLGLDRIDDVRVLGHDRRDERATVVLSVPGGRATVRLHRDARAPMRLTCSAATAEPPAVWQVTAIE